MISLRCLAVAASLFSSPTAAFSQTAADPVGPTASTSLQPGAAQSALRQEAEAERRAYQQTVTATLRSKAEELGTAQFLQWRRSNPAATQQAADAEKEAIKQSLINQFKPQVTLQVRKHMTEWWASHKPG